MQQKNRCFGTGNPIYEKYHDEEWGVPIHDEIKLFELLILEGFQAGLSWEIVLNKRENFRKAFDNFDFNKIVNYDVNKLKELYQNKGIITSKLKIDSTVSNAKVFIQIQKEFGSFDKYIWGYVNNNTIKNSFQNLKDLPAKTELSEKISKDLKKRGMKFMGPVIVYSYLQAIGLINDHIQSCFKY